MPDRAHRILIVDDNSIVADSCGARCREMGCEVFQTSDISSSIEILRHRLIDLAIIDWALPDGTGKDLLNFIQTTVPTVKTIVHSLLDEAAALAFAAGADDFILKTGADDRLRSTVQRLLFTNRKDSHLIDRPDRVVPWLMEAFCLPQKLSGVISIYLPTFVSWESINPVITHWAGNKRLKTFDWETKTEKVERLTGAAFSKKGKTGGGILEDVRNTLPVVRNCQNAPIRDLKILRSVFNQGWISREGSQHRNPLANQVVLLWENGSHPPFPLTEVEIDLTARSLDTVGPALLRMLSGREDHGEERASFQPRLPDFLTLDALRQAHECYRKRSRGPFELIAELGKSEAEITDYDGKTLREVKDVVEREYLISALKNAAGRVAEAAEVAGIQRQRFYQLLKKHQIPK